MAKKIMYGCRRNELITMITEKNNMHDLDTWMFFRYFVKMWIAVYLVSNTWTITMAVFDVGRKCAKSCPVGCIEMKERVAV